MPCTWMRNFKQATFHTLYSSAAAAVSCEQALPGSAGRACQQHTSKDPAEVIPHVCEVQILFHHREVRLEGRDLLSQDEELLDEEQLPIHG